MDWCRRGRYKRWQPFDNGKSREDDALRVVKQTRDDVAPQGPRSRSIRVQFGPSKFGPSKFGPSKQESASGEMGCHWRGKEPVAVRGAPSGTCGTDGFGQARPGSARLGQARSGSVGFRSGTPSATFGGDGCEELRADEGGVHHPCCRVRPIAR